MVQPRDSSSNANNLWDDVSLSSSQLGGNISKANTNDQLKSKGFFDFFTKSKIGDTVKHTFLPIGFKMRLEDNLNNFNIINNEMEALEKKILDPDVKPEDRERLIKEFAGKIGKLQGLEKNYLKIKENMSGKSISKFVNKTELKQTILKIQMINAKYGFLTLDKNKLELGQVIVNNSLEIIQKEVKKLQKEKVCNFLMEDLGMKPPNDIGHYDKKFAEKVNYLILLKSQLPDAMLGSSAEKNIDTAIESVKKNFSEEYNVKAEKVKDELKTNESDGLKPMQSTKPKQSKITELLNKQSELLKEYSGANQSDVQEKTRILNEVLTSLYNIGDLLIPEASQLGEKANLTKYLQDNLSIIQNEINNKCSSTNAPILKKLPDSFISVQTNEIKIATDSKVDIIALQSNINSIRQSPVFNAANTDLLNSGINLIGNLKNNLEEKYKALKPEFLATLKNNPGYLSILDLNNKNPLQSVEENLARINNNKTDSKKFTQAVNDTAKLLSDINSDLSILEDIENIHTSLSDSD